MDIKVEGPRSSEENILDFDALDSLHSLNRDFRNSSIKEKLFSTLH